MKRSLLTLLFALSFSPAIFAAQDSAFFYLATRGADTAWLFGSVHMAKAELYPLRSKIEEVFKSSEALAVEVYAEQHQDSITAAFLKAGTFAKGKGLRAFLPDSTYGKLTKKTKAMGLPTAAIEGMRPWSLALTLAMDGVSKQGVLSQYGIEQHFLGQAGKKEVLELENWKSQVEVFSTMDSLQEIRFLELNLLQLDSLQEQMDSLIICWKSGEEICMERLSMEEFRKHPEFKDLQYRLFTKRNRVMAKSIHRWGVNGRQVFSVLGTAHLVGKNSVVELLEKKGWTIVRK